MLKKKLVILLLLLFTIFSLNMYSSLYPLKRITFDMAQEGFPFWSPDGKIIVYSWIGKNNGKIKDILKMIPSEGGNSTIFTNTSSHHANWSSDGIYIIYDGKRGSSIEMIPAEGGIPVSLIPENIPIANGGNPCWSKDNTKIVFRSNEELWVLDHKYNKFRKIFYKKGFFPLPGCWSLDGKYVYINLANKLTRRSNIWKISLKGNMNIQITFEKEKNYRYMDLSPDGSLLAFSKVNKKNVDLWVMSAEGGKAVQLTNDPKYDDTPRWSPDGKKIAFTSSRTGRMDIYVLKPDILEIKKKLNEK